VTSPQGLLPGELILSTRLNSGPVPAANEADPQNAPFVVMTLAVGAHLGSGARCGVYQLGTSGAPPQWPGESGANLRRTTGKALNGGLIRDIYNTTGINTGDHFLTTFSWPLEEENAYGNPL
jgi:hypothetical protein